MRRYLFAALVLAVAVHTQAQLSYTTLQSTYTENFDSMGVSGTTTPAGWFVGRLTGAISGTSVVPSTGSSTTGTNYNFGATGVNPDTDRALGSLGSSAASQFNTEVRFINNTGHAITDFAITYDGEQWRSGGTNQVANSLVMQYSTDGSSFVAMGSIFDFTSPIVGAAAGALDGNAGANRTAGITGIYAPSTPVPNGATIYLRWVDVDNAGSDAGIALDNFSFTAAPEPAVAGLVAMAVLTLGMRRRISRVS